MGSSALPLIICLLFFTQSQTYKDAVYVPQQNRTRTSDEAAHSETVNHDLEPSKTETPAETDLPTLTVTVTPDSAVFTGETVKLTCVIKSNYNDWTYEWYKDSTESVLQLSDSHIDTLTISGAAASDQGQYWCRGWRSGRPNSSQFSSAVSLSVKEKPVVDVSPDQYVFTGEKVTLTCHIQTGGNTQWTYSWIKDGHIHYPYDKHSTTSEAQFSYEAVSDTDAGEYSCELKTSSDPQRSVTSAAVKLTVSAKPVVKVTPRQSVFTGEKVTLTCHVQTGGNTQWTYRWITDGHTHYLYDPHSTTSEAQFSFGAVSDTDAGQYSCELKTSSNPLRSVTSAAVKLTVSALPRSTVTVTRVNPVFTGETVNLKCVIDSKHSGWTYVWYKDNTESVLQSSDGHRDTLTISRAADSNQGQYWCRGQRSGRPNSSQFSSAADLSVKERPKPIVKVSPDQRVFIGETVTLTCDIQTGGNIQWTKYSWIKNYPHTRSSKAEWEEQADSVSFQAYNVYFSGQYSCRGERSDLQRSDISTAVKLTVSAKPVVTVSPDQPVFFGETVTLTCHIETGGNTQWTYSWIKDGSVISYSSERVYSITTVLFANAGQYSCELKTSSDPQRSVTSDAVKLTVLALPTPTVTVTPDSAVFTGETVKLKCVIKSFSGWTYEWYTDRVKLQSDGHYTVNRDNLTISGAAASDQGQYWCRGRRSGRPNSSQLSSAVSLNVTHLKSKPKLRSDPAGAALTGNTVTLTCNTDLSTGWDFYWYKNTLDSEIMMTRTNSYRIKIDLVSDGGQYWCRAGRGKPVYYTQYSDELKFSVTESPKAVVTVRPDKHVFKGETVTFRCEIKWGGNTEWTYRWQIEQTDQDNHNNYYQFNHYNYDQYNQHKNTVSRCSVKELKINRVEVFHRGNYSCTGQMNTQSSLRSDAVALTVSSDEAQAAVRVSPQPWLTEGHSVTLICEVPGSSTGWTFSWFRDADHLSDSSRGAGGSYTLSPAALQHTGVYTCRAERGEPAYSSQNSSAQPLWVTGVSASVRLLLNASRSQHFSSDSLSLSCDSAGWRVRRYTHTNTQDCSAQTGSTCGIQSLSTSDTGVYWCESESGEKRHPLNITVHDGPVILESSADPVIEGETLTLHCLHRSTISSILTADFYKDGSLIQNQTGEMSIPTVSKSDEGFYYCKSEGIESPHSWISVRGSSSSLLIIGVSVGLSVFLLLLILLVLLLRHKKKKDPHCGVQPTLVSNPSGESQTDNLTLQSGPDNIYDDVSTVNNKDEEPVADVTYSEVTLKKNIPMNEDENIPGQSNTMYADVGTKAKKPKRKDINTAGPSDMTYAAISKKDKKKTTGKGAGISDVLIEMKSKEKHGGMSSKSGDTLYSELKLNTDGAGADAGGDATYAQVLSKKKKKTRL